MRNYREKSRQPVTCCRRLLRPLYFPAVVITVCLFLLLVVEFHYFYLQHGSVPSSHTPGPAWQRLSAVLSAFEERESSRKGVSGEISDEERSPRADGENDEADGESTGILKAIQVDPESDSITAAGVPLQVGDPERRAEEIPSEEGLQPVNMPEDEKILPEVPSELAGGDPAPVAAEVAALPQVAGVLSGPKRKGRAPKYMMKPLEDIHEEYRAGTAAARVAPQISPEPQELQKARKAEDFDRTEARDNALAQEAAPEREGRQTLAVLEEVRDAEISEGEEEDIFVGEEAMAEAARIGEMEEQIQDEDAALENQVLGVRTDEDSEEGIFSAVDSESEEVELDEASQTTENEPLSVVDEGEDQEDEKEIAPAVQPATIDAEKPAKEEKLAISQSASTMSVDHAALATRISKPMYRVDDDSGVDTEKGVPSIYDAFFNTEGRFAEIVFYDESHCASQAPEEDDLVVPYLNYEIKLSAQTNENGISSNGKSKWGQCLGQSTLATNHTARSVRCFLNPNATEDVVSTMKGTGGTFYVDLKSRDPNIVGIKYLEMRALTPLPKVFLSTCSMITTDAYRDERDNLIRSGNVDLALREWVEYHRQNGVERMIIFDNTLGVEESQIESQDIITDPNRVTPLPAFDSLRSYIDSGFVVYHHWNLPHCQPRLPNQNGFSGSAGFGQFSSQDIQESVCIRRYGPSTEWMGMMDGDEYFMTVDDKKTVRELLTELQEARTDADSFVFNVIDMAKCANQTETDWSPLLRHITRVPQGPPRYTNGLVTAKEFFRTSTVWHRSVHGGISLFFPSEVAPKKLRGYGNGLNGLPKKYGGVVLRRPTRVLVDVNTTGLVLHADDTFEIVPNSLAESMKRRSRDGDIFGSCPRPFSPLMLWLERLMDTNPTLYDARDLQRRWSTLISREDDCTRIRLKGTKSKAVYANVTKDAASALAAGPNWEGLDEDNWVSLPTNGADGQPQTMLFQLRCHKMDI